VGRGLRAVLLWVDGGTVSADHIVVDAVLHVATVIGAEQPSRVRVVLGEQQGGPTGEVDPAVAVHRFVELDETAPPGALDHVQLRPPRAGIPRPRVAKPHRGEDMDRRRLRTAIDHGHLEQEILGIGLRVFDVDVEVTAVVEDPGVVQLELGLVTAAAQAFLEQRLVRKAALRILVEHPHIGMRRRAVQVEVLLLHILAVIAFVAGEAEEPLFQDRIALVPQRDRQADALVPIAHAGETVFIPAIGARAGVIVGKVLPRGAVLAVVLSDRSPRALGQVRPPSLPVLQAAPVFLETLVFGCQRWRLVRLGCAGAGKPRAFGAIRRGGV
jgi:hypothetical protein